MICVVPAAVNFHLDLPEVGGSRQILRGGRSQETGDESCFGQGVIAAVQPDVESNRAGAVVGLGNNQSIGLDRAIQGRVKSMDLAGFLPDPRRLPTLQLVRTFQTHVQDRERVLDTVLGVEGVRKFEEPAAGLRIHLDVRDEVVTYVFALQFLDDTVDCFNLGLKLKFFVGCRYYGRRVVAPAPRRLRKLRCCQKRNRKKKNYKY